MQSNSIRIRAGRTEDLPGIERVEKLCFPASRRSSIRSLRHSLNSPFQIVWVAEAGRGADREIVGVMTLHQHPRMIRIYSIGILRPYRGAGVGGRMIRKAIQLARRTGRKVISLEADARKKKLIAWYTSFGFVPVQRLIHYYPGGLHGIRMHLPVLPRGVPHGHT